MTKLITIDYEEYEDLKKYKELFEENWETDLVFEPGSNRYKKIIFCKKLYDFLADENSIEICLVKQTKESKTVKHIDGPYSRGPVAW